MALADALRAHVATLHRRAERSGALAAMLHGDASQDQFAMLLRNLLPAYQRLEAGLLCHAASPLLAGLWRPELCRADIMARDLALLAGPAWPETLALLPEGAAYAACIEAACAGDGRRLIAHAYARYLGDLSGGQIIRGVLLKIPGLPAESLGFYAFPAIADLPGFKAGYRATISTAGLRLADWGEVLEEAAAAFEHAIAVSVAVETWRIAATGRCPV